MSVFDLSSLEFEESEEEEDRFLDEEDDMDAGDLDKLRQDEVLKKVLSEGIDLRQYARQIEKDLYTAEEDTINQYLAEAEELAKLHLDFKECGSELDLMQKMLGSFQSNLGNLTSEIKNLRQETMTLSLKLANRRLVQKSLSDIANIDLSINLTAQLSESPISIEYLEPLKILAEKAKFCLDHKDFVCIKEVQTTQNRLINTIANKAYAFFNGHFMTIAKPRDSLTKNQTFLLDYRYLYDFCAKFAHETGSKLRHEYGNILMNEYFSNFTQYLESLKKIQDEDIIDPSDHMGMEESRSGGFFTIGKRDTETINRYFILGARDHVLTNVDSSPLNPDQSRSHGIKLSFDAIMRSTMRLFTEFAYEEHRFVSQFFQSESFFQVIFKKSAEMIQSHIEKWLETTGDIIGVLILIRTINWMQNIMKFLRDTTCMQIIFDKWLTVIYARFYQLLDTHHKSIAAAKCDPTSLKAHYVTVRFAHLCTAIRSVSRSDEEGQERGRSNSIEKPQTFADLKRPVIEQKMNSSLFRLRQELDALLAKITNMISVPKKQSIFLINNYDFVLMNLRDRGVETCEEITYFSGAVEKYLNSFVEEEMVEKFGRAVSFISQTELAFGRNDSSSNSVPKMDTAAVESIVKKLASTWQESLQSMVSSVVQCFSSSSSGIGMEAARAQLTTQMVIRRCLISFLKFCEKFDFLVRQYYNSPSVISSLVSLDKIKFQVKKYDTNSTSINTASSQ